MTLTIDTSKAPSSIVFLGNKKRSFSSFEKSDHLLLAIANLLVKENCLLTDISAIQINSGPGSFTGLRIGLSVANLLGWYLKVPVNGRMISQKQITLPKYG
ncbi:MAG: hypothetical protein PHX72_02955 [Candidatus Shapirobacteria bacterium]|nr:hypothetical protein [Candidatus Shapirobacteria bacterium]